MSTERRPAGKRPAKKATPPVAPLAVVAPIAEARAAAQAKLDAEENLSVQQAIETGDERKVLVAMRRVIARKLDDPNISGRDLASNTRRLHEITKDIMAIDERRRGLPPPGALVEGATGTHDEPFDGSGV